MATIPSSKSTKSSPQKKNINEQNLKTLNRLALQPTITIKKNVMLKNYNNTQKNSQNKVTNTHKKVPNSHNKVTKSQNHIAEHTKQSMPKKSILVENVEYHPDRCKRNVQAKKIKLQPKHDYRVVATTNKRKRRIPHRGVDEIQHRIFLESSAKSPTSQESVRLQESSMMKELSLSALVQLAEDQGLDDEDFMEILTCPSPVWWEETSDDDISIYGDFDGEKLAEHENTNEITKKSNTEANANKIDNKIKTDINFYKKFISKRSKLEKILGKLKYKKKPGYDIIANKRLHVTKENNMKDNRGHINYSDGHLNEIEEQMYNIIEHTNNIKASFDDFEENLNGIDESANNNKFRSRKRKVSSGGLSDVSINEDELLNTLESIELPVKKINDGKSKNKTTDEIVMMEIRNKPVKTNEINSNNVGGKRKRTRKQRNNNELKLKDEIRFVSKNNEIAIDELTNQNELMVPTDLPPLTKNPFKNIPKANESPKSIESNNSETVIELDSISDTNIKFLDEYVDVKKEPTEAVNVKKYGQGKDGEMVTVYQIITNKTDSMMNDELDIEEQIKVNLVNKSPQTFTDYNKNNGEINSFYKTRKSAYRSRSKYKKK